MTCCSWIAVAGHARQILAELRLKHHCVPLEFALAQRDHLPRRVIQVHSLEGEFPLGEHGAQLRDHLRGAVAVPDRCGARLRARHPRRAARPPASAGTYRRW